MTALKRVIHDTELMNTRKSEPAVIVETVGIKGKQIFSRDKIRHDGYLYGNSWTNLCIVDLHQLCGKWLRDATYLFKGISSFSSSSDV